MYYAVKTHAMAEKRISESCRGILTSEQELNRLNAFVTPLMLQGQSIHRIYVNYADTLMCSEKTLYNYIDQGFFDARNITCRARCTAVPAKRSRNSRWTETPNSLTQKCLKRNPAAFAKLTSFTAIRPPGSIEVNHELVRRILPKDSSFGHPIQADIKLMITYSDCFFNIKSRYL